MKIRRQMQISTLALFAGVLTASASAQTSAAYTTASQASTVAESGDARIAAVPFGIGERGDYKVSFGGIGVGKGSVAVEELDTIRGIPAYRFVMRMKGGIPFAHVDDVQESWMDVGKLTSLRFHQNLREVKYKRNFTFDMFPAEMLWRLKERDQSGPLGSAQPLDDISFIYWVRTIPLEVGKSYTFQRYFKQDGNPVVVKVVRRQTVKVPAGTFNTIVLQPIIKTKGLFAEGGEAELYFNDDSSRMLVMLTTKLSFGSIKLQLEKYTPGRMLTASQL